jgi:hypothetical protein
MDDTALRKVARQPASLGELAALIERVERRSPEDGPPHADAVRTGLPSPLDRVERGMLHEWLCGDQADSGGQVWTAPILVFAHLVREAVEGDSARERLVVWIGRRVWPQPNVLVRQSQDDRRDVLRRSLLIDPRSLDDRMWAVDLCLRSNAVSAVVADVSGMSMAQSRRLQLAAESGRALALFARPWNERKEHSAAARRWRIEPTPSPNASPRWRVELVRCKGVQQGYSMDAHTTLIVEHDHATHCLRTPADVADRSRAETTSTDAQPEPIRRTG